MMVFVATLLNFQSGYHFHPVVGSTLMGDHVALAYIRAIHLELVVEYKMPLLPANHKS